ncbi:hypothetical protein B0A49_03340 [Cryomyces minteri]|uniref:glucan endo-1,3-beta-D-glucosidase n=1 Tax=Cryomyces minteri TaxID=331657 RepID=A0A4U0XS04_9PEZI|nr:hypothetical protein B0A49_03603 [Cryomyces minteri]TKA79401.1 hypothetical protein B0A49_03340 [Cryomyces minteri]
MASGNIFRAISGDDPPPQIPHASSHPVPRKGIIDQNKPLSTNKYYANFFLGNQTSPSWTHPYSLTWSKGQGNAKSYGIGISHIRRDQLTFGPPNSSASGSSPALYFINPIGIWSIHLSAAELGATTSLTTDTLTTSSVNVNLAANEGSAPLITFPLEQGMGFVTGIYKGAQPFIESSVFFRGSFTFAGLVEGAFKYRMLLEDDMTWLFYVVPSYGTGDPPAFTQKSNTCIQGPQAFSGTIHVAKVPVNDGDAETRYDASAGVYPVGRQAPDGRDLGSIGSYTFAWNKAGLTDKPLLTFVLPHHVQSFDNATSGAKSNVTLVSTTKGMMTAVVADSWTMVETLPKDLGLAPYSLASGSITSLAQSVVTLLNSVAQQELSQSFDQRDIGSMYYSGKGLAKYSQAIYATHLAGNVGLVEAALPKLKDAIQVFVNNTQRHPLVYDEVWKGLVSSAGHTDAGADFGNTYYNDHHFHYGYFVLAGATIGALDPSWLSENNGQNRAYVNALVKDYANPVVDGEWFPFSRSFDWFHGHSWAKGLFDSLDGKDQESTSEDALSAYAIQMWGRTIGDSYMEARGALQLAVLRRSLDNYFLMKSDNAVQPPQFIGEKVTGILFENKVDHTTYFGANTEYIEGIHMLPLLPFSTFTRSKQFVQEEWDTYFSGGRADAIQDKHWLGVLYANLAIIDPVASYNFFATQNFDKTVLDGGASRTWYLAWAAALGGA